MVRYGGFFFKYPDTWNYYKSKGRKCVCVWDGGGGGVIVQIKNIPNANRMKISCIFSLISQEKKCSEKWLYYR